MDFLHLLRYIKGYVIIRVYNGFTERFVNLCTRQKINLWDVRYNSEGITAKLYAKDFMKLKYIKNKSGVNIEIVEKHGLLFMLRKHKSRRVLLFGTMMSICLMLFMNLFVWNIEIIGNSAVSNEEILKTAEALGLKFGTFSPLFDEAEAGRKAINQFDGKILWLSINIKGSKATVEVRDNNDDEEKPAETYPCNFVADFDGILESTQTFSGEQKAYTGTAVSKGTILISGIFENEDGSVNYIHSDGVFTAKNKQTVNKSYDEKNLKSELSESKTYYTLEFLGRKIPLNLTLFLQKGTNFSYSSFLAPENNVLPLGIKKTVFYEKNEEKSTSSLLLVHIDNFSSEEYSKFENTKILNSEYKIKIKNGKFIIKADYNCVDFIGKKTPIETLQ